MEDIPYHALVHDRVREDRRLFYILASASFIEITSNLYTRNLAAFFRHDSEIVDWLEGDWESEEVQHGAALKRYVQTAWPDFDWQAAYQSFVAEYSRICTLDQLAATRALEMAARCVVETGTATFYRMLSELSREPLLKRLAAEISADEVPHYKHFYRDRGRLLCLQSRLPRPRPRQRLPQERLSGVPRQRRAARQAPLSPRNGDQDAAEAARPQSHGRARDGAGRHVGHAIVRAFLGGYTTTKGRAFYGGA